MTKVINARCYDLKKEQVLICEQCGFELTVMKEYKKDCEGEGCCTLSQFTCCNEPVNYPSLKS